MTSAAGNARALSLRTRALAVVGALAVLVLRRPAGLTHPYLWAEDGRVFLADTLTSNFPVAKPYAGQLFVAQRLLFEALRPVPLQWLPRAVFVTGLVVVVGTCATVLQPRLAAVLGGGRTQLLAFAMLVLLPGTWEIAGDIVNVHWWMPFSVAAILLAPRAMSRWGAAAEAAWLLIVGLSGLTAVFMAPLGATVLWKRRDRVTLMRLAPLALGALAQLATLATSSRHVRGRILPWDLLKLVDQRVGGVQLVGYRYLDGFTPMHSHPLFYAAGAALVIVSAWVAWTVLGAYGAGMWLSGLLCIALGLYAAPDITGWYTSSAGGRYFVDVLGFSAVGLAVALFAGTRTVRMVAAACIAACAFGYAADFSQPAPRPLHPAQWRDFTACVRQHTGTCTVEIAPPKWDMTVTY